MYFLHTFLFEFIWFEIILFPAIVYFAYLKIKLQHRPCPVPVDSRVLWLFPPLLIINICTDPRSIIFLSIHLLSSALRSGTEGNQSWMEAHQYSLWGISRFSPTRNGIRSFLRVQVFIRVSSQRGLIGKPTNEVIKELPKSDACTIPTDSLWCRGSAFSHLSHTWLHTTNDLKTLNLSSFSTAKTMYLKVTSVTV